MTNDSWAPSAGKSTLHLFTLNMAASCARAAAGPPRALQHERGIFDGVVLIMVVILVKVSHCAWFFFFVLVEHSDIILYLENLKVFSKQLI